MDFLNIRLNIVCQNKKKTLRLDNSVGKILYISKFRNIRFILKSQNVNFTQGNVVHEFEWKLISLSHRSLQVFSNVVIMKVVTMVLWSGWLWCKNNAFITTPTSGIKCGTSVYRSFTPRWRLVVTCCSSKLIPEAHLQSNNQHNNIIKQETAGCWRFIGTWTFAQQIVKARPAAFSPLTFTLLSSTGIFGLCSINGNI